jgi:hypothetical protein
LHAEGRKSPERKGLELALGDDHYKVAERKSLKQQVLA